MNHSLKGQYTIQIQYSFKNVKIQQISPHGPLAVRALKKWKVVCFDWLLSSNIHNQSPESRTDPLFSELYSY